jgi:homoserine O-acetyltransferase
MMRTMMIDDIRNDPAWKGGDYATQPPGLTAAVQLLFMMTSSPLQLQKEAPTRDSADAHIHQYLKRTLAIEDANDYLYQFAASSDYDPAPNLERIVAPVLAINSADDQVNPPELGLMEKLIARVKHGRYVLIPISDKTRGHGTHSLPTVWKGYLGEFLGQIGGAQGNAR